MLSFMSAKEAAEKWNISQRRVAIFCSENRINGAMMVGNMWIIPAKAEKPCHKSNKSNGQIKNLYEITIEETISQSFQLEAINDDEAMRIAKENYKNGLFVLEPGNLISKKMDLHNLEKNYYTEWVEF